MAANARALVDVDTPEDYARAVARAGAIGGAAIPGDADDADVEAAHALFGHHVVGLAGDQRLGVRRAPGHEGQRVDPRREHRRG